MKATTTILIIAVIAFGCHRKTIASADNIVISNKTNTETKAVNTEVASPGQTVYTNRCGRCHGLKKTENYTQQRWENILKIMVPKARLNDEEAKQVTAYAMANAKK